MRAFDHIHPDFANIPSSDKQAIKEALAAQAKTGEKVQRFRRKLRRLGWGGSIGGGLLFTILTINPLFGLVAGLLIFLGFLALQQAMVRHFNKRADWKIFSLIASPLGLRYQPAGFQPVDLDVFKRFKLLPKYDRMIAEDLISGERLGADFDIYRLHLLIEKQNDGRITTHTKFRGQLIRIDYHARFLGQTVVKQDAGLVNFFKKPGKSFEKVAIISPQFEKTFEVWSTDQTEARYLLDPLFLERLLALEAVSKGQNLRLAFANGSVYLVLDSGGRVGPQESERALGPEERLNNLLTEIAATYDLIDVMIEPISGVLNRPMRFDDTSG